MPEDFEMEGNAEALAKTKMGGGGRPGSEYGVLADEARAIGTAELRAAVFVEIEIDGGAGGIAGVREAEGAWRDSAKFQ